MCNFLSKRQDESHVAGGRMAEFNIAQSSCLFTYDEFADFPKAICQCLFFGEIAVEKGVEELALYLTLSLRS